MNAFEGKKKKVQKCAEISPFIQMSRLFHLYDNRLFYLLVWSFGAVLNMFAFQRVQS